MQDKFSIWQLRTKRQTTNHMCGRFSLEFSFKIPLGIQFTLKTKAWCVDLSKIDHAQPKMVRHKGQSALFSKICFIHREGDTESQIQRNDF